MEKSSWDSFKSTLKQRVPRYFFDLLAKYRYELRKSKFKGQEINETFTEIFNSNHWKNKESVSGPGSTLSYTEVIIPEITKFLKEHNIRSMIDAPCGDFNWMKEIDLESIQYLGIDIVEAIINTNVQKFESENTKFKVADITKDYLPPVDLVFCRDCLVHFSYDDIFKTLANLKSSGSSYLMTTSFRIPTMNYDIQTGHWRPLNLERPPFNFSSPEYIIEDYSKYFKPGNDLKKILGLWKISDLELIR